MSVFGSVLGASGSPFSGNVDYFSGVVVAKVDLDDAIIGPTSFAIKFPVPDPAGMIAGGLSTTATGLEFTDGTNTATLITALPAAGEDVISVVEIDTDQSTCRVGRSALFSDLYHSGDLIWDMSETTPAWGLSSIDSGETGEFVTTTIGGVTGRFAHLVTASGSTSAHADIYRGVITTSPVDFPSFTADDTFTLAVYMQAFSGTDAANSNASSTTPYVDLRFSSGDGKEIGGLFRTMRFPGVWQYLTLRAADFTIVTGGELITNDMQRVYIRCFNNATTGTGAEFYIGKLWKNKKTRPKLILELDDGWLSTYTQAFQYCRSKGVKISVPLAAEAIGTNDTVYCNWDQVEEMAASGIVEFIIHSNKSHTVDLTTYQQVYDDTVDKIARMAAHGLSSRHYVYPQGKFDSSYSFNALNDAGIVTAAHTAGGNVLATSMGITVPMMLPRATMNHTIGSASVIASIDKAIKLGTTCRLYGHQVLGPAESVTNADLQLTYDEFTAIIDAAADRRDKGLIDIVFVEEWYSGKNATAYSIYGDSVALNSTIPAWALPAGVQFARYNRIVDANTILKTLLL